MLADNGYPHILARSCNGRVWDDVHVACYEVAGPFCTFVDFASTPAMTVSIAYLYDSLSESGYSTIEYSADLVTWGSVSGVADTRLATVVVGDP